MRWLYDDKKQTYCSNCRKAKKLPPTENCGKCNEPELMPMNVPVVNAFHQVKRCWRNAPSGVSLGFEWSGVQALMALLEIPDQIDITHGLLVMEAEILNMEYEKRPKNKAGE